MQGMRDCYYAHFLSKNNHIKSNLEKMHTTFSLFEITYRYMTNSTYIHVCMTYIVCIYITNVQLYMSIMQLPRFKLDSASIRYLLNPAISKLPGIEIIFF